MDSHPWPRDRAQHTFPRPVERSRSGSDTAGPASPPVLIGRGEFGGPRQVTDRHDELIAEFDSDGTWSATALLACLGHLRVSTVTEAARVAVIDAWTDGPDAFCVVYRPPFDAARVVGLRRARQDATELGEWRIGDLTTWGYELRGGDPDGDIDPVAFGWNVADFDLGEPLGFVATVLRYDRGDVGWWGNLDGAGLSAPVPTASAAPSIRPLSRPARARASARPRSR